MIFLDVGAKIVIASEDFIAGGDIVYNYPQKLDSDLRWIFCT